MAGRIERIELWHVNVPLPAPFWPSWIPGYPQTHVAQTYARFITSDGLTGETAGPAFTTERRGLGDLLGGFLLGMAADDMDGFRKRIREASYLGWRNWWLEAAMSTIRKTPSSRSAAWIAASVSVGLGRSWMTSNVVTRS